MTSEKKNVLIVGLGLIGGSYAQGLTKAGYEVGGLDMRRQTIDYALKHGYIAHGRSDVDKAYIERFDIVVFALYPSAFVDWIAQYQHCLKKDAVITDVTGVKGFVVERISGILRPDVQFVPAHPMAGREVYGIENADCRIFKGANFIITPIEGNTPEALSEVRELARALDFRRISELGVEKHDEMIGFLSQLTHCIAVSLMTCKESSHLVDYTGDSFRDLTRIAKINADMWSELFIDNKAELLSQMDLFLTQFTHLRDAIDAEDLEEMKRMMEISTERRSYFDKKGEDER